MPQCAAGLQLNERLKHLQLWTRYMAYFLHATEVDKARAIAERALKTISFR